MDDYQEIQGQEKLSHSKLCNMRIVIKHESPKVAVSRSPASSSERQLWRKQPLKSEKSAVVTDPNATLINGKNWGLMIPYRHPFSKLNK
jgi:hypothetical protein